MTLHFTIPGEPQGKQRHRTGKGHSYTPAKTKAYQKLVVASYLSQCQALPKPHTGPVRLECVAYMKRPKAHYGTGRNAGKLKDTAPYWPLIKPDFDNIEKAVADSLNAKYLEKIIKHALKGYAYEDDCQVVDSHCLKLYQMEGFESCVQVSLIFMQQETMSEHAQRGVNRCRILGQ